MPSSNEEGAPVYVRGTGRSSIPIITPSIINKHFNYSTPTSSSPPPPFSPTKTISTTAISITSSTPPPPFYTSIFPPSPPSSLPESASEFPLGNNAAPLFTPPLDSASELLSTIFPPTSPIHSLPATLISLSHLVSNWTGVILEDAARGTRTLLVTGGSYDEMGMRESVCGVLELAEEEVGANGVVVCLEKGREGLGDLLHSLLYVGGTVASGPPFEARKEFILVGLDV